MTKHTVSKTSISDHDHPLRRLLPPAVALRIQELADLPDDAFVQRWQEWRDEAVNDPRFASEAVLYRTNTPGESEAAFHQLVNVIAVLAFVHGGVTAFNQT